MVKDDDETDFYLDSDSEFMTLQGPKRSYLLAVDKNRVLFSWQTEHTYKIPHYTSIAHTYILQEIWPSDCPSAYIFVTKFLFPDNSTQFPLICPLLLYILKTFSVDKFSIGDLY